MIAEKPLSGHGIGSFYLSSTRYGEIADPNARVPNFAHNVILQFAAELGMPAALLLTVLLSMALVTTLDGRILRVTPLSLALATYIATQFTSNSLNIYVTHQIYFWFLFALAARATHQNRLQK
jgi:O-antigen ligase